MTSREMHYDFKMKLNRIDSQKNRKFYVPEIDWKLNEAQDLFIKNIAQPRRLGVEGFEKNQRSIDDIRTVVVTQFFEKNTHIPTTKLDSTSWLAVIPPNYKYYVRSRAIATKGNCKDIKLKVIPRQHDDDFDLSPFDRSSFEWREVVINFIKEGIRINTDGTFDINGLEMVYIKEPVKIHNAQDFDSGRYKDQSTGEVLTGFSNCELPSGVHGDIVDLAVLITAGDLGLADYPLKKDKENLKN